MPELSVAHRRTNGEIMEMYSNAQDNEV